MSLILDNAQFAPAQEQSTVTAYEASRIALKKTIMAAYFAGNISASTAVDMIYREGLAHK